MASAPLTISLGVTGENAVSGAFKNVSKSIDGVGNAAKGGVGSALAGVGSALGGIASIASGAALGVVMTQLPGALMDMAKSAAADEQATARLNQTLDNLPGNFEDMQAAVNGAIATGQKLAFSDDDIRDSFQSLAVATGDSAEALKRQKIALDLARGANIPLATASKMLGKVNEENVDGFKRLGINIKEGASEAEALAAVQEKFAGQANTYAQSTAGQFEAAQLAMGEITESIGSALLPVFSTLARALADMLPVIQEWVGAFAGGISELLGPALQWLSGILSSVGGDVVAFFRPLLDVLPDVGEAIKQALAFFATGAGDIEKFRGVLTTLIGAEGAQGVIEVLTNLSGFVRETVIPMFVSFGEIVKKVLSGDLAGALDAAIAHIATFTPKLIATLVDWGKRFIEWVAPLIPPLLAELGRLALSLLGWIAEQIPAILAVLAKWGLEFVKWVGPMIPPLLLELGKLLLRLLNWIGQQEADIAKKFVTEWVPAAIKWVGEAITDIVPKLADFLKKIVGWIGENAGKVGDAAVSLGKAMIDGIARGVQNFAGGINDAVMNAVRSALGAGERAIRDWVGRLPGMGGGGATSSVPGGGGGAHLSAMGIGAPITINNVIDARGHSTEAITQAVGDPLATLMRTRVNPRSYA
jgi:phage-related protein